MIQMNYKRSDEVGKYRETEMLYHGRRLRLLQKYYEKPSGKLYVREIIDSPDAVTIVPITKEGKMVVILQQREAIDCMDSYEFPAGKIDVGENDEAAAKRELQEETGWKVEQLRYLLQANNSNGYSTERTAIFIAEEMELQGKRHLDENENIEVMELTIKEVEELIQQGKMNHMASILGFYAYFYSKHEN